MENHGAAPERQPIDWADVGFACFVGVAGGSMKLFKAALPAWSFSDALVCSLLVIGYVVARGRRELAKLDEWGITTPLTVPAILVALALLAVAVASQYISGVALAGRVVFEPWLPSHMLDYILGAFPQQFFLCSVGLVNLAKLPAFRGAWRLPLAVAFVFGLAHWWTPARIPGTIIPVQMIVTVPLGFLAAAYFLRFRNILPLTAMHAILFPLWYNWVEVHLPR